MLLYTHHFFSDFMTFSDLIMAIQFFPWGYVCNLFKLFKYSWVGIEQIEYISGSEHHFSIRQWMNP
jgi:hypothetical protein